MTYQLPRRSALLLAAGLAAASLCATLPARADDGPRPATISVSAEGSASVTPDMAIVTMMVLREADTAREALDANNKAMQAVLSAMKDAGIEDRDLQTSNFSIQPRWFYPERNGDEPQQEPKITGYQVSNGLSVRVRDISRLGEILDTSVTLGVNQGGNIVFTNENPDATISAARKEAVEKALAKARELTQAAGVKLGRVVQISEQSHESRPVPMARAEFSKMAAAPPVPVAAGENEYNVNVNMTWEISQ